MPKREPTAPTIDFSEELLVADPLENPEVANDAEPVEAPAVTDASFFASPEFSKIIKSMVDNELAKVAQGRNSIVAPGQHAAPSVTPSDAFLKHYRCDASPEMEILELDMSSEAPHLTPKDGQMIRFRRGHFFATTENQVKQIEWMIAGARGVPDAKTKFGGVTGIYEDSGEVLYHCPYGCSAEQFVTASKDAYHAHLRATHNVEI